MRFLLARPSLRRVVLTVLLGVLAVLFYFGSMACPRCAQATITAGRCHCWSFIPGPWWLVTPVLLVAAYVVAASIDAFLARDRGARAA
jgi:hypothetical protein